MAQKLNKEWHLAHPMPVKPTMEQRIQWHIAHAKACACREMPESIRKQIEERKKS